MEDKLYTHYEEEVKDLNQVFKEFALVLSDNIKEDTHLYFENLKAYLSKVEERLFFIESHIKAKKSRTKPKE